MKNKQHIKENKNVKSNAKEQKEKVKVKDKEINIDESEDDSNVSLEESGELPEEEIEEEEHENEEQEENEEGEEGKDEQDEEDDNVQEEEEQNEEQGEQEEEEQNDKEEYEEEEEAEPNDEQNEEEKEEQTNNKNPPEKSSPPLDPNNNGIFISGIPYTTPSSTLQSLFSQFGTITSLTLPKYQDSNRNIGYAHIYFSTASSAHKALSLNNHTIDNRYITVQPAKYSSSSLSAHQTSLPKAVPPSSCLTAFIKNLPYTITEKEVGDKFRSCGKIKSIRFVYNSKNNNFKGFCYIDFVEHHGLLKALELNGKTLQGRVMKVDFDEQKPKKGYKYAHTKMAPEYNREYMKMLNIKRKKQSK